MIQADQDLAILATAHAVPSELLHPSACLRGWGVNDTEAARVLLAIIRGAQIVRTGSGRWYAPTGSPLNARSVSVVVNEMIRTGLLINWPRGMLIPARVHLKRFGDADDTRRSWCEIPAYGKGPIRVRAVSRPDLVDCPDCLGLISEL